MKGNGKGKSTAASSNNSSTGKTVEAHKASDVYVTVDMEARDLLQQVCRSKGDIGKGHFRRCPR